MKPAQWHFSFILSNIFNRFRVTDRRILTDRR